MKILIFKTFICLHTLFSVNFLFSQTTEDKDLLRNTDFTKTNNQRVVAYGFSDNPSKFSLYNPLYHLLSSSMWVYQKFISPQLASECPYKPSCSQYSKQLIRDFGIIKGVCCSADRLMRCNRITLSSFPSEAFDPKDQKIHETTNYYSLK